MNSKKIFDLTYCTYSDLAIERGGEELTEEKLPLSDGGAHITVTRQKEGDRRYVTMHFGSITTLSESELSSLGDNISDELAKFSRPYLPEDASSGKILVIGLGNRELTADAIGPFTAEKICATRQLKYYNESMFCELGCHEISSFIPGVAGKTGMESGDIVKKIADHIKPHVIIAVDALAARSVSRLASTVQISDSGISPGSGIGNTRTPINEESMGCPVIAIGIPTGVNSSTLVYDALSRAGIEDSDIGKPLQNVLEEGKSFVVSPKDADRISALTSSVIARAIDRAFGISEA